MAAYRRPDRSGYFIRPTLPPPFGRVGPWATGMTSKRQAEAVEAWLQQAALENPALIQALVSGRTPDERIFEYTEGKVRHLWDAARDRAAGINSRNQRERGYVDPIRAEADRLLREERIVTLPVLRFKDLRHLLPTAWNALGFSEADLQEIMGHAKGSKQTRRYITARISGDRERMDRVASYLGLDRLHMSA